MTQDPAAPTLHTDPAPVPLDVPIILFGFNRPAYLERVCASLLNQRGVVLNPRRVFLLQDGAVSLRTGLRYAEDAEIEASIAAFRAYFPRGQVAAARGNLGIAANIRRGEALAFEALDADCAYFFEDDLELGPEYLRIMGDLRVLSDRDLRIGYFAAYGNHKGNQTGYDARIFRMAHHWGFGLKRNAWRRLRAWLAPYDAIVDRADYGSRDNLAIYQWMETLSVATPFSSQDAAKTLGCQELGIARVMTNLCFGRYIGAKGASFTEESFRELGFEGHNWLEGPEYRLVVGGDDPVGKIIADRKAYYERVRQEEFPAFLAKFQQTHFDAEQILTRSAAERLCIMLLDAQPGEELLNIIADKMSLRNARAWLMRLREAS
ncbi:hypothetical protein [Roseomonas chloroacetimidivorans]|uniref:hypothetical protein n=1 Tax=Roseomonas chloroacetimidivorans TaxID=1766656 RepID=UPI003C729808